MKTIYVILLFVCIFVNASGLLEEYRQTIKDNNDKNKLIEKEKIDNKELIPRMKKLEKRINANMTNADIIEENTKDITNNNNIVKVLVEMKVETIIANKIDIIGGEQFTWNENLIPKVKKQIMGFVTENYELFEENKKLAGELVKKKNVKIMEYEQTIKENDELIKALINYKKEINNGTRIIYDKKKLIPRIDELMETNKEENEKLSKMIDDIIKDNKIVQKTNDIKENEHMDIVEKKQVIELNEEKHEKQIIEKEEIVTNKIENELNESKQENDKIKNDKIKNDIIKKNQEHINHNNVIIKVLVEMKVKDIIRNDIDEFIRHKNRIQRVKDQIMGFVRENYELFEKNRIYQKLAGKLVKKKNIKIMENEQIIEENDELTKALIKKKILIEEKIKNRKDFFEDKKKISKINELMKTNKEENEKLDKEINDIKEKEHIDIVLNEEENEEKSKKYKKEQKIVEQNELKNYFTPQSSNEEKQQIVEKTYFTPQSSIEEEQHIIEKIYITPQSSNEEEQEIVDVNSKKDEKEKKLVEKQ